MRQFEACARSFAYALWYSCICIMVLLLCIKLHLWGVAQVKRNAKCLLWEAFKKMTSLVTCKRTLRTLESSLKMISCYRDPNSMKTLDVFDNAVDWATEASYTQRDIDEAKLSVFSQVRGIGLCSRCWDGMVVDKVASSTKRDSQNVAMVTAVVA